MSYPMPAWPAIIAMVLMTTVAAAEDPPQLKRQPPPEAGMRPKGPEVGARPRAPGKAAISLACEKVITLSTGSGRGTCTADQAAGTAKCDDGDGNSATAACPGCRKTTGTGSCTIN